MLQTVHWYIFHQSCENPQHVANGDYVIITERIIPKFDMEIDHIITYPKIYLVLL